MLAMWHPSLALALSSDVQPTKLRPDLAPNQSDYNPTDPDLREAAGLVQRALNAENVKVMAAIMPLLQLMMPQIFLQQASPCSIGSTQHPSWLPQEEERLWTLIIDKYGKFEANWVPDVVGRAWGNRGNARSRQGKLQEALADYNEAIRICPWSGDPVLNRYAHSKPL